MAILNAIEQHCLSEIRSNFKHSLPGATKGLHQESQDLSDERWFRSTGYTRGRQEIERDVQLYEALQRGPNKGLEP